MPTCLTASASAEAGDQIARGKIAAISGAALIVVAGATACGGSSGAPHDAATKTSEWSYLTTNCRETPSKLDSEVRFAYTDLQHNGVSESYDAIETAIADAIPASEKKPRCDDLIAAYLVLRES